ncbi:MAG: ATP-binding protein [Acidobacteriota bacterium]
MKLRSLHVRLALVLLLLLLSIGGFNFYLTLQTTRLYQQEGDQAMHFDLASNIADRKGDQLLDERGEIRPEGAEELLHWMMVVNPGAQFYLLDLRGHVLAFDKMAGEPLTDRVDLLPVKDFLDQLRLHGQLEKTVEGTDPRAPHERKIFSVAALPRKGPPVGYLYVVLESHGFDSAAESWRNSYILRLTTFTGLAYLAVVLLLGWLVLGRFTRPLRQLAARIKEFLPQEGEDSIIIEPEMDEIDLLDRNFGQMKRRTERQMAENERMSTAHRELIANVSHDLRTPIASLRGYLDTLALKDGVLSKAERDEYLQIALRQSERLGRLVDELFQLTKLDAHEVTPNMERFRLGELVQDNVQRFQLKAEGKGVHLKADFDPDLPPVRADVGLMERALENLIGNALRYTPKGGSVTVELRENPNCLDVRVIDTGCGIAADDLPHIFDRYYRSRSGRATTTQGAGLGLAITRRILELHDSELDIQSAPGVGTTVAFSLIAEPRTHQLVLSDLPLGQLN